MRALTIADSAAMILGLQDEIRRSEESRYDHRLHGVLLVAQGMTCPEVARRLGDAPRSVEYSVHHFDQKGLAGLIEGDRSGRPRRLDEKHLKEINQVLREKPSDAGMRVNLWDVKTLSAWIEKTYSIYHEATTSRAFLCSRSYRLHNLQTRSAQAIRQPYRP